MENLKSNPNSHLTAIERTSLSYPARILMNQKKIHGKILDFGCGVGKDVELLATKGYEIKGYDPHYFPEFPTEKFDTIICFYVLNVLLPDEQEIVLKQVKDLLKQNGKAYFAVRRDVYYEGFRMHKLHKKQTYQCQVKLPFETVFKNENCEIYEFQNYNQLKNNVGCIFCYPDSERELILETAYTYAIYDKSPAQFGHALIIPKTHCAEYTSLTINEQSDFNLVIDKVKELILKRFNPKGFDIGKSKVENIEQDDHHFYLHLLPRYNDDIEEQRSGVRGVIPNI